MSDKPEKRITDWRRPEDRQRYEKSKLPSTSVCPLSRNGVCIPSLTTPRDSEGTVEPFPCWSQWYQSCPIFQSNYGGLRPDTGNKEVYG